MRAPTTKRIAAAGVALLATGSTAALAFTGQPGAKAGPVTDGPDLVSVTLAAGNGYGDREAATFCFDADLTTTYAPRDFFVKTYDANRFLRGLTAAFDPSSSKCVIVTFNPRIDLAKQGSIGEVDAAAVTGTNGTTNYVSNAPLTGSSLAPRAGQTTGPDLIGATADQTSHQVAYSFDQQVDPTSTGAGDVIDEMRFGLVAADGTETTGTGVARVDTATSTEVTIQFATTVNVSGAARYYVRRGAVRTLALDGVDGGGAEHPFAPTTAYTVGPDGAVGSGSTTRPVLTGAQQQLDGSSQFVLTYQTDLGTFDPAKLVAVRDNGEIEAATSSQPISGSTTKRLVSFPNDGAVDREPSGVVAIVSRTGASSVSGALSPTSAADIGSGAPMKPGLTNGPDLLDTALDTTTSQASFIYDEPVDQASIGAPAAFGLLVQNGNPISGVSQGGTLPNRKTVLIGYPGSIEAGVGVTAGLGATRDKVGNLQQYSSISSKAVTLPPEGTASPTPSPSATPSAMTVATRISIKHKKGSRRFTGKVTTKSPCKRRTVRLYRGSKQIKHKRDRKSGKYTITFKKRQHGRIRARVTKKTVVKDGVTYTCTSAKSKKVSG